MLFSFSSLFGDEVSESSEPSGKKTKYMHDGVLDIDYLLKSSCALSSRVLHVDLHKKTGTFNVYAKPEEGFEIPLLATPDLSSSSAFLLKLDERVYDLGKSKQVAREVRAYDGGAQIVYLLEDQVRFIADFSLVAAKSAYDSDIVRVRLHAINLGILSHSLDVKALFDTVCGESSSIHFTTENHSKIRYEQQFSWADMQRERTVVSSNGTTSFQFVFDGVGVTPVEAVSFANIDEFYKNDWNSGVRKGRSFSNIRGYDDSAIMVDWNEFVLEPDERAEITFFIAVSVNDAPLRGLSYVDGLIELEEPVAPPPKKVEQKEEPLPPASDKRTDVEFVVPPIKDYQLDPEYIQNLIDRIDALQSSKTVDKKEIQRLNAELDAILEKLRQR